jgi:ABC-type amino acid transport substrate-binding protein
MTFIDGGSVLVRGSSELLRLNDLAGKRIAVASGTTTEKSLPAALKQRGLLVDVVVVNAPDKAIEMLSSG